MSFEDLNHLNNLRIDAVHRTQARDYSETLILLEVGGNFLESSVHIKGASAGTDLLRTLGWPTGY